jgi:atypical dual specificity phosphatase
VQQSHTRLALYIQGIRQSIQRLVSHCLPWVRSLRGKHGSRRVHAYPGPIEGLDRPSLHQLWDDSPGQTKPSSPSISQPQGDGQGTVVSLSPEPTIGHSLPEAEPVSQGPIKQNLASQRSSHQSSSNHRSLDWVIPGKLAVGAMPQTRLTQTLIEHRIKVILSVCQENEGRLPKAIRQGFRCLRVPLTDSRSPHPLDAVGLGEAVDLIQWNINKRMPVYIHCLAGMERSPTVCLAYLCRYQHFDLIDALGWLRHVHPATRITGAQLTTVRHYLQSLEPTPPSVQTPNLRIADPG